MNISALEFLFEEMDCTWVDLSEIDSLSRDGYLLRTNTLSAEQLKEIGACRAGVESCPANWFRVYDDE